ncbi:MAG: hypothetical protein ACYTG4_12290, partial [Planctomycetota bacterium]
MKKLVLLAVVFGCVCGGIGQVSHAATMVVAVGGGAEYTDIQTAIDAAADGDTVSVQVGEYVIGETITFGGKAITVVAEGGSDATMLRGAEETGTVVRFDGA